MLFVYLFTFVLTAFSAETATVGSTLTGASSSTSGSSSVLGVLGKKFDENTSITDARLKAETGSLSLFSLRFNLMYFGPPVGDLGALNQPNPDQVVSRDATAISGSAGLRARITSADSLSVTAGVSDLYPFTQQQSLDVNDPALSYDHAGRLGPTQVLSSVSVSAVTTDVYKNIGENYGSNLRLATVTNLGESNFAVGVDNSFSYYFFDRPYKKKDGKIQRARLTVSPSLKYNINRKLSVSTGLTYSMFNPRNEASWTLHSRRVSQRFGFGYALTRDIYISPVFQFYPSQLALRTTTVNLITTISVF